MDNDDIETRYQELLSDYNREKEYVKQLGTEKLIDEEIQRYDDLIKNASTQEQPTQGSEISTDYGAEIDKITSEIQDSQTLLQDLRNKNAKEMEQMEEKIAERKKLLEQLRGSDASVLDDLEPKLQKVIAEAKQIDIQIEKGEAEKSSLQKQVSASSEQSSFLLAENQKSEAQKVLLSETVARLKKEAEESQNQIIQLNEKLNKTRQECKKNEESSKDKQSVEKLNSQIQKTKGDASKLETTFNELCKQAQALEDEKKSANDKERKVKEALEENRKREEKMRLNIGEMKEEKQKILEEKKKKKGKPTIDFKTQTIRLKKENEMLEADRERQLKKLKELAEVRKTYVKQEQLLTLKEQLDKYREANRPIQANRAHFLKLEETHKTLLKSIDVLKKNQRKLINEKENHLNQTKEKVKELTESKTFYDKNISHCQTKLTDYMKEFPNHERDKLEQKEQEKKKRNEERKRKRQEEEALKLKREAAQREAQKEKDEIPTFLPVESDASTPFYMNQTVQYGALGAVAVVAISSYFVL